MVSPLQDKSLIKFIPTLHASGINHPFSHPDFHTNDISSMPAFATVGSGITPDHAKWLAGYTAGKELHLAPKNYSVLIYDIILLKRKNVQQK